MDLSELVTIHTCTLIVIAVSLMLGYELWKRYRNTLLTSSLLIFLYVMSIAVTYITILLFRFPTPEENLVQSTGILIPAIGIGGLGFIPYPGALFSIYVIEPRGKKAWIVLVSVIEAAYILALIFYPPVYVEVRAGAFEWVATNAAATMTYLTLIIAAVPVVLFAVFSAKSKDKQSRAKGIMLAVSFAMLAFFVTVCDGIGGYVPIGIRRVCIAIAVILLYLGFIMPSWLSRILKV
jgi:magnesium-transporting ATPase (P-type)